MRLIPARLRCKEVRPVRPRSLENDATLSKDLAQPFDAPSIYTQVGMADARCRTDRNKVFRRAKMKLQVIDEAEQSASAFRVDIVRRLLDHGRPGQTRDLLSEHAPGSVRRSGERKRFDAVCRTR